jgi:hypothetical protein
MCCLTEQLLDFLLGLHSMQLTESTAALRKSNWDSSGCVVTTLWPQRLIYQGSILGG